VAEEYYVLMLANSFGSDIYSFFSDIFGDKLSNREEYFYDFGRCIGHSDFLHFSSLFTKSEDIKKLQKGFLANMSLTGWGSGEIFSWYNNKDSENGESMMWGVRVFDGYERNTWQDGVKLLQKRSNDLGHCLLTMAYMAGWCETYLDVPMIAVEVSCNSSASEEGKDKRPCCDFIIAHPNQVENFVAHYHEHGLIPPTRTALAKIKSLKNTERPGMGQWLQKILPTDEK